MKNYLGRMVLLVEDYEKSSKFYEENFGFSRTYDVTTDVGQRFLHIGSEGHDGLGIWFLKADTSAQKERVGNQTGEQPAMVIYTTEIEGIYNRLKQNKTKFKTEIVNTPEYSFFHCFDIDGNEIIVTQLHN